MQDTARVGIPTVYDGIEYRSRLEAKWAAFFREIGWEFTYEPFDGNGYIPDFLTHGESPLLVEVKPAVTVGDYASPTPKMQKGVHSIWSRDLLVVGVSPIMEFPHDHGIWGVDIGHNGPGVGIIYEPGWYHAWSDAPWIMCSNCQSIGIFHSFATFNSRPCGCHDGDHFLGQPPIDWMKHLWNEATNDVKWRGKSA